VRLRANRTPFFVVSLPGTGRHTGMTYSAKQKRKKEEPYTTVAMITKVLPQFLEA
jgi:hypothetical protein